MTPEEIRRGTRYGIRPHRPLTDEEEEAARFFAERSTISPEAVEELRGDAREAARFAAFRARMMLGPGQDPGDAERTLEALFGPYVEPEEEP